MPKQLELDFGDAGAAGLGRRELRRAVLAWLALDDATGVATDVPTRISRYLADVAAFWSRPARNRGDEGPGTVLRPYGTTIVECRRTREECWPDCNNSQELSPQLLKLRQDQRRREAQIREREPQLRGNDMLFDEYTEWQYDKSRDRGYHELRRRICKLEAALYRGTRFEGITRARLADRCYLAVPAGAVDPHELADGWGLLWVDRRLRVKVVAAATQEPCRDENRLHLVQNIAAAAQAQVLFANGIARRGRRAVFLPLPRRRRGSAAGTAGGDD